MIIFQYVKNHHTNNLTEKCLLSPCQGLFWGHRKVLEFPLLPLLGLEPNHSGVFSFIAHFLISVVCPALMSARFRSPCSVSSYPVFKNPCHQTLNSELKFKATHKLVQPRHVSPETETEEKKGECPTVPHESRELSPGGRVGVLAVKVDVVRKADPGVEKWHWPL